MILMALDHARDFIGPQVPVHGIVVAEVGAPLFLTRWITHFCAPVFVMLAGTGAYLQASRGKSRGELSRFLLTRGLWLVLLEITVIRVGWTFDLFYHFTPLQVIWAIGWSMVVLGGLVYLPRRVVLGIGLAMIALHHLADAIKPASFGAFGPLWNILHVPAPIEFAKGHFAFIAYPLVPWIGVMAAGYGLGEVFEMEPARRRQWLYRLGAGLLAAFVVLRYLNGYGSPEPWSPQANVGYTLLSFLNCTKYPPSLTYLLMTLGPALLALGAIDGREYPGKDALLVFGRAPLFYYILHLFLLHGVGAGILYAVHGDKLLEWAHGPMGLPREAWLGLPSVYGFTAGGVLALYPLCRWFADLKRRRKDLAWLSYL